MASLTSERAKLQDRVQSMIEEVVKLKSDLGIPCRLELGLRVENMKLEIA